MAERRQFKRQPMKYYYVSSRGDSGYAHNDEFLEKSVELYTSYGLDLAVYELKTVHEGKTDG